MPSCSASDAEYAARRASTLSTASPGSNSTCAYTASSASPASRLNGNETITANPATLRTAATESGIHGNRAHRVALRARILFPRRMSVAAFPRTAGPLPGDPGARFLEPPSTSGGMIDTANNNAVAFTAAIAAATLAIPSATKSSPANGTSTIKVVIIPEIREGASLLMAYRPSSMEFDRARRSADSSTESTEAPSPTASPESEYWSRLRPASVSSAAAAIRTIGTAATATTRAFAALAERPVRPMSIAAARATARAPWIAADRVDRNERSTSAPTS